MNKIKQLLLIICLLSGACAPISTETQDRVGVDQVATYAEGTALAAQTALAQQTQAESQTMLAASTAVTAAADTETPGEMPTIIPTQPNSTPIRSTSTSTVPTPTAIVIDTCDQVNLLGDVASAAGTQLFPGETFNRTWRLMNVGDCTWNGNYALIFIGGNPLGAPKAVNLNSTVEPGGVIDLTLKLTAPKATGNYSGEWKLRTARGGFFGPREDPKNSLWVNIDVIKPAEPFPSNIVDNFLVGYCSATWSSGTGVPLCSAPGNLFTDGYVIRQMESHFEGGHGENEPILLTIPSDGEGGFISARYPSMVVQKSYRFETTIGCLEGATYCDVTFQLNYSLGGGPVQTLGSWQQVYDGKYDQIVVDLSLLAGKSVEFILTVLNNGESKDDQAFWLVPAIYK